MDANWYLVWDRHRFHVYVAVETELESLRIDWHQNSTLEFAPFVAKEGEEKVFIGHARYCYQCLVDELCKRLYRYHLFSFNCRTVSFLIMTEVLGFGEQRIYEEFKKRHTQCGLDSMQCFSPSEIDHFIEWRNAGNTIGNNVFY